MISLKQLEALHWIATLGTFQRAAEKMNTTQSAVSKRVQELEASLGQAVFDRGRKRVRLTPVGEQVLSLGREMLGVAERIQQIGSDERTYNGQLRLGITQLSAMTWLPRFVEVLSGSFPDVKVLVEVSTARALYEAVLDDALDIAVLPDFYRDDSIVSVRVSHLDGGWLASPELVDQATTLTLQDLADHVLLVQGSRSVAGPFYTRWLKAQGVEFGRAVWTDSLPALAGLAVAKLGVAILPPELFAYLIDDGRLARLNVEPLLPPLPYAMIYKQGSRSAFTEDIGDLILKTCSLSGSIFDRVKVTGYGC